MERDRAREELKGKLRDYVESITQKSKGANMYACPLCGSGKGKNHTGAFSLDSSTNYTSWKCFSCNESGDIFDLIGKVENITDYSEQLKRAGELFNIEIQGWRASASEDFKEEYQKQDKNEHTQEHIHTSTYTDKGEVPYYRECAKRLPECNYLELRGISRELANRFMLGYEPHFKTKGESGNYEEWKAIIIPTGYSTYTVRNTDQTAGKGDRVRKRGASTLFNAKALRKAKSPIFIVEGEIDALSIIEVGGEAVGLGGLNNTRQLITLAEKEKPSQPLILALDNDPPAEKATAELREGLEKAGLKFYEIHNTYRGCKDANELLQKEREELRAVVIEAEQIEEKEQEAQREEYLLTASKAHIQDFINGIAESVNTPATSTGFTLLDTALDGGLYSGLIILGAIPSLGKTSLLLQLMDQVAQSGKDVIIFSLEMARSELMAKSISRLTLLDTLENGGELAHAKTTRGILAGARYANYCTEERKLIERSITAYSKYADHIFIHEGMGDIGAKQIREAIEKHILYTGNKPTVLVDYIQLLAPYDVRATDKQNTDKSVMELKRISRDFNIPVIGISSFNRAGYREAVTMEAYKESGAIEYTSDLLLGLQLKGAGTSDFNPTEAKQKNPREIELVILKNRNGATGKRVEFQYFPLFNYFKEA